MFLNILRFENLSYTRCEIKVKKYHDFLQASFGEVMQPGEQEMRYGTQIFLLLPELNKMTKYHPPNTGYF